MMAAEWAPAGGADPAAVVGDRATGPMVGEVATSVHNGVVVTVTLDPAEQKFLDDHRIDGTPVLPGVMGMESFAEAASLLAPEGYRVGSVEDVAFLAPVKFFRDQPRTLTISAVTSPAGDGTSDLVARCTLTAERKLPGSDVPQKQTHFTGTVRLTQEPAKASTKKVSTTPRTSRWAARTSTRSTSTARHTRSSRARGRPATGR